MQTEDFAKCDHECPDEIHQKSIDGLLPEKSYCDLQPFHDPLNALPPGKKGYLSNDDIDHPPTSDSLFGNELKNFAIIDLVQHCKQQISLLRLGFLPHSEILFENKSIFDAEFIQNKLKEGHDGVEALQQMAEVAQTYNDTSSNNMQCKYVKLPDTIRLIDSFTDVASSLIEYKPILMQESLDTNC
ncbi:11167_t:CDS:2 [Dentiscutata erythropus]|uniref:11167_t:CDS:1 n=1 Tax=Dentiscutata erythropus TaxID=1348616 RepID=A0A9N9DGZ4_9GLOM|nr:11167_t:CDS:2 [Dentiscutata erythropus]